MSFYSKNTYDERRQNHSWSKIFQFVAEGKKVLDIGCSSGNLGAALKAKKQNYVVGVDLDEKDIRLAKAKLDEAHVLNVEQDPLEQLGKFDIVIMADVIEHLIDPLAALKKIKKLLNKDGRLVFSIPNMANVTTRLELLGGRFEYKDFGLLDRTHFHFYDKQEVNRVFKEAGFEVKQTDCTIREIPEPILRKNLKAMGIELTDKLKQHLYDPNALIFQFIGFCLPSTYPKSFEPKTTTPLDVISQEIDELRASHQKIVKQKDADADREITQLNQRIVELDQELKRHAAELNKIYQSRGWKLLSKTYTLKHRFTKKDK